MKDQICRFTLRTKRETLDKLWYIAWYNGRTKNKELERLLEKYIEAFEREHEEIRLEEVLNG